MWMLKSGRVKRREDEVLDGGAGVVGRPCPATRPSPLVGTNAPPNPATNRLRPPAPNGPRRPRPPLHRALCSGPQVFTHRLTPAHPSLGSPAHLRPVLLSLWGNRSQSQHAYPFFGLLSSRLKCDWVPWIACHFSRLLHEHRKRGFLKHFRQSELHVHLKCARNVLIM